MTVPTKPFMKRARQPDIQDEQWESDTITVQPRKYVALDARIPLNALCQPPSDDSAPARLRSAVLDSAINNPDFSSDENLVQGLEKQSTNTPTTCCYHCRKRGGKAAYKCIYEDGQQKCRLCIQEGAKCRMPTDREADELASRCSHCIRRGFKSCIGRPCEHCINEGKANTCGQPISTTTVRNHCGHAREVVTERAPSSTELSSTRSRSKAKTTSPSLRKNRRTTVRTAEIAIDVEDSEQDDLSIEVFHEEGRVDNEDTSDTPMLGVTLEGTNDANAISKEQGSSEEDSIHATLEDDDSFITMEKCRQELQKVSMNSEQQKHGRGNTSPVEMISDEVSDQEGTQSDMKGSYPSALPLQPKVEDPQLGVLTNVLSAVTVEDGIEQDQSIREHDSRASRVYYGIADSSMTKPGKSIDLSLPPIDNIEDAFFDMASKGIKLGLPGALRTFGRQLDIGTMCSGTEAPVVALQLLSRALQSKGLEPIKFVHRFSVEIDVPKQGFIERNFQPAILFRDVREFGENANTATTAYGATEEIPAGLDILVAGFVCKDLSGLNQNQKSLEDDGESGDTWRAIFQYAKTRRPKIVLLENVKNKKSLWEEVVEKWNKIGYEACWKYCDTKSYYLPQTRERMYMIAIDRSSFGDGFDAAAVKWKDLMRQLQRPCSSPYEAFLAHAPSQPKEYAKMASEPNWALCKLRYDHIRSKERLGIRRPITRWSENGTLRPPDCADVKWYHSQSPRVYDAIEVASLQEAVKGNDSLYKMAIWDVSQNVDRFKAPLGILPCITPGGCDFASNKQKALDGTQLLLLQGLPLQNLYFGRETPKECQDLAGNAMSTTVIGASLVSAIISALKSTSSESSPITKGNGPPTSTKQVTPMIMSTSTEQLDVCTRPISGPILRELADDALTSSQLCVCETNQIRCKVPIHTCTMCGHTVCSKCTGNPKHVFHDAAAPDRRRLSPDEFMRKWKTQLPIHLRFAPIIKLQHLVPGMNTLDEETKSYIRLLLELRLETQCFSLQLFVRKQKHWKITYCSSHARLEVNIGQSINWFLYINCARDVPGNSLLRALCERPFAKAVANISLLQLDWKFCLPILKANKLQIRGSVERTRSWRSRLGLLDFADETVPSSVQLYSDEESCNEILGRYDHLPHCGTASNCLYKLSGSELYLFLDPDPIGRHEDDHFVISYDCRVMAYGEKRATSAVISPSWRPWLMRDSALLDVDIAMQGKWVPTDWVLEPVDMIKSVSRPISFDSLVGYQKDCSQSFTILDVRFKERLSTRSTHDYAWALQHVSQAVSILNWQKVGHVTSKQCPCAPQSPRILWNVNDQGIATPREDQKAASIYERAIKTRPSVFNIQDISKTGGSRIVVGINPLSLIHRALGRLKAVGPVSTAWRLVTDHADLPSNSFAKLRLSRNAEEESAPLLHDAMSYLSPSQRTSVAWMRQQELGQSIAITEVEEAVHSHLGWRAEAQATTDIMIRGGVLADLPSFGKTVTTIGLIQHEFEDTSWQAIRDQNQSTSADMLALLETTATLILCPPHMSLQWRSELKKFLGEVRFSEYKILVIESFAQLQDLTTVDITDSRIIIASWSLFAEEGYVSHLAHFAAMPPPIVKGRRAFDTWLRRTLEEVSQQIPVLQQLNFQEFLEHSNQLLQKRLQQKEFQDVLPLQVRHGSAYQSFRTMQTTSASAGGVPKPRTKGKSKTNSPDPGNQQVPLLHLFRYNRVVIDEYHYLEDKTNVLPSLCIKSISAHKRWVLSGTPPLSSFTDVSQIASYLNLHLGRFHDGNGAVVTIADKTCRADQTKTEDFLDRTVTLSRHWHETRHRKAQEFLDLFVRQNPPCLGHIACKEVLIPVELDVAHQAIFLELSQVLRSQKMQLRKISSSKRTNDRTDRLRSSLDGSATAEESLLKSTFAYEEAAGESGLDALIAKRSLETHQAQKDLSAELVQFRDVEKGNEMFELYKCYRDDITQLNWLGDEDATRSVRMVLAESSKPQDNSALIQPKKKMKQTSASTEHKPTKHDLSKIRELSRDIVLSIRAERFLNTIKQFVQPTSNKIPGRFHCNASGCKGASISQLQIIADCGHTTCDDCLKARLNEDTCIHPMCNLAVYGVNFVKATDLCSTPDVNVSTRRSFGKKLDAIIDIILDFPNEDQGLVFAPSDEIIEILEIIFDHYDIPYHSLRNCRTSQAARIIEDFKDNTNPNKMKKVLLFNLRSETAAGVNLINANHIIFAAPFLAKTQDEHDSAMAQAIARCRRYGQKKTVHLYHVVALRTIDVDVLEHRHKRVDGITIADSTMNMPAAQTEREKTRLVRDKAGNMALVPASWLVDESRREVLGLDENPSSFASLISFSETFQQDEDDWT